MSWRGSWRDAGVSAADRHARVTGNDRGPGAGEIVEVQRAELLVDQGAGARVHSFQIEAVFLDEWVEPALLLGHS